MSGERRLRILTRLVGAGAPDLESKRLCEVCAEVTETSGAAIMLMSDDVSRVSLCTTNAVSARIDELEFGLGEGPGVDAQQQDRPVLEPDLAAPVNPRWLAFTGGALEAGARAVFGFPLRLGAIRLGALHLYRDRPGPLTDEQHADALVMADVVARTILMWQANAPPGQLAEELDAGADFQYVVHQAAGMISAQLQVSVGQALVRLRAYAFGHDRPLREVAEDVIDRRLRFDAGSGEDQAAS